MYKPNAVLESSWIHIEQIDHEILLNHQITLRIDNIKDV